MRFVGIDPSTKTGFVALAINGQILKQKEIKGIGSVDPKRIATQMQDIRAHLQPNDFVCIEGMPFNTQNAMTSGGIHFAIRIALWEHSLTFHDVNPTHVKKWVQVSDWTGEKGSKVRIKGKEKKALMMKAVADIYGVYFTNDNINDAYILARIARAIYTFERKPGLELPKHQADVIGKVLKEKETA